MKVTQAVDSVAFLKDLVAWRFRQVYSHRPAVLCVLQGEENGGMVGRRDGGKSVGDIRCTHRRERRDDGLSILVET